jgi:outer membrane protein
LRNHDSRNTYVSNFGLQINQPLLRNFGSDVNNANIYLAQRDYRESLSQFKQDVMKAVSDVEEAYHALALERTNVEIQERLVVASQQTFDVIWDRRTIDATKASMYQALSALESRETELLVAQRTYREASDKLKVLMNDPDLDPRSNILINPVDRPLGEPFNCDVNDCIDIALRQRPELQRARLAVERADITVHLQRNALLPKLDLVAGMTTNGIGTDAGNSIGNNFNPASDIDFKFGLTFEIPLGNRAAEAELQRKLLERKQQVTTMVQIAQTVMQDVRTQARSVLSSYAELQKRDRVRIDSANELQGILEIEEIRGRTPEFLQLKLDSQQRLATAEQAVVQALVNYNVSIERLELAKGTLLEFNHISLDRPPAKFNQGLDDLRFMGETFKHGMDLSK